MTAPKFTPGPWWTCRDSTGRLTIYTLREGQTDDMIGVDYGALVGSGFHDETDARTSGRDDANVILMSAAPELYEALSEMLAQAEDFHRSTGHDENSSVQCDALCALIPKARAALAKAAQP